MEKENEQDSQSSHRIQFGHDRSNKVLLISLHHSRTLDNYSVRVLVPQVSRLELGLMSAISRPSESENELPPITLVQHLEAATRVSPANVVVSNGGDYPLRDNGDPL